MKPQRHSAILDLVRSARIPSQEVLRELLGERGFEVAQATLSRDIRELGLAKTPNGYLAVGRADAPSTVVPFVTPETRDAHLHRALAEFAVSIEQAGTLVVVKTRVAAAQPLALAIDASGLPNVAGTIAGDDTIFIAVRSAAAAARLVRQFRESVASPRRERRATRA